jgi:hypothetical protein
MNNQEFRIFFSGTEPDSYFNIVAKESNAMLISYFHMKRLGRKFLKERLEKRPDLMLLVDSGAHTFFSGKQDNYTDSDWEGYLTKYVEWARKNKEAIFAIVELDIDTIVGQKKVQEWRAKYFEPLEKDGINVCYVWHPSQGDKEWENMCKKYSYVGFSLKANDLPEQKIHKMFMTAKKYGALIHGFGVTDFKLISKYPFYTSDSSTWLVGTQYAEINYFDGRESHRLKKDKWKRQYKTKLIKLGANWKLMEREDPYELQRVNVLTLLEVERFVQRKIKAKSYWLKGKSGDGIMSKVIKKKFTKVSDAEHKVDQIMTLEPGEKLKCLPKGATPEKEWFDGDRADWKAYAFALGVDIRLEEDEAVGILKYFYAFCNNDVEEIKQIDAEELYELCEVFGDKTINTQTKAIAFLRDCFQEHAQGERGEFNNFSETETDGPPAEAKERECYAEEKEYITVDLSKKDCDSILAGFLPSPDMPEVDAYDEELRKLDIVPVRDEKGRFLKGQQKVRKNKKIYSDLMPKLACDTCYKADGCPKYKPGYVCAFHKVFKQFNTRNSDDVLDAMHSLVEVNIERLQRMMMFEQMDGGFADQNVTSLIDQNMKYLNMLAEMESRGKKITAQQRIVIDENGKTETVTTVSANPQSGGILQKLFSGGFEKKEDDFIDITPEKQDLTEK